MRSAVRCPLSAVRAGARLRRSMPLRGVVRGGLRGNPSLRSGCGLPSAVRCPCWRWTWAVHAAPRSGVRRAARESLPSVGMRSAVRCPRSVLALDLGGPCRSAEWCEEGCAAEALVGLPPFGRDAVRAPASSFRAREVARNRAWVADVRRARATRTKVPAGCEGRRGARPGVRRPLRHLRHLRERGMDREAERQHGRRTADGRERNAIPTVGRDAPRSRQRGGAEERDPVCGDRSAISAKAAWTVKPSASTDGGRQRAERHPDHREGCPEKTGRVADFRV